MIDGRREFSSARSRAPMACVERCGSSPSRTDSGRVASYWSRDGTSADRSVSTSSSSGPNKGGVIAASTESPIAPPPRRSAGCGLCGSGRRCRREFPMSTIGSTDRAHGVLEMEPATAGSRAWTTNGAGDILEIERADGETELLPFTDRVVPNGRKWRPAASSSSDPSYVESPANEPLRMAEQLWTVRVLTLFPKMFPGPLRGRR